MRAQRWGWERVWGLSWGWLTLGKWGRPWKGTEAEAGGMCPWGAWGSPGQGCLCGVRQQSEGG